MKYIGTLAAFCKLQTSKKKLQIQNNLYVPHKRESYKCEKQGFAVSVQIVEQNHTAISTGAHYMSSVGVIQIVYRNHLYSFMCHVEVATAW